MLSAKGVATRTIDELLDGLEEDDWAEDELLELEDELEDEPLELNDELLELDEEALELDVTEELAVLELDEEASAELELSGDEMKLEEETPRRDPQPERVKTE